MELRDKRYRFQRALFTLLLNASRELHNVTIKSNLNGRT